MTGCPMSDAQALSELIDINVDFVAQSPYPTQRSEHGKGVADLRGSMTVLPGVPAHLQHGVFAQQQQFEATIRFSNGAVQKDSKRDTHGIAIKLHDVDLPTAPKDDEGRGFQDFILLDSPIFVMGNMHAYVPFNRLFLAAKISLLAKLKFGIYLIRHWRMIPSVLRLALNKANAPLSTPYWSTTPYRLGDDLVVKYKLVPDAARLPGPAIHGFDGRRAALRRQLDQGPGRFTFGVIIQTDPKRQPIEDPSVNWEDHGADFHPLARIDIPQGQPVEAPAEVEYALSYSPGHAAWAHFPLGQINRARVAIYAAAKKARRAAYDHKHRS